MSERPNQRHARLLEHLAEHAEISSQDAGRLHEGIAPRLWPSSALIAIGRRGFRGRAGANGGRRDGCTESCLVAYSTLASWRRADADSVGGREPGRAACLRFIASRRRRLRTRAAQIPRATVSPSDPSATVIGAMARLASSPSASPSATLFPAPSVARRPERAREQGVSGKARATPGNRKNRTTTYTMTPVIEEILEQLVSGGSHRSLGEVHRRAVMFYGAQVLGAEAVAEIVRRIEGEEALSPHGLGVEALTEIVRRTKGDEAVAEIVRRIEGEESLNA